MDQAFLPTTIFRAQSVSSVAAGLSGVTQLELAQNRGGTAWITCETAAIRYRFDGTNPTTGVGHRLPVDTPLRISGRENILAFRMIGDGGSASTVSFTISDPRNVGGIG